MWKLEPSLKKVFRSNLPLKVEVLSSPLFWKFGWKFNPLNRKEILTKNLVTFKRWDGLKDEKFEYYGGSLKNLIFRGGFTKNQCIGGIA